MDGVPRLKWPAPGRRSASGDVVACDIASPTAASSEAGHTIVAVPAKISCESSDAQATSESPAVSSARSADSTTPEVPDTVEQGPSAARARPLAVEAREKVQAAQAEVQQAMASPDKRDEVIAKVARGAGYLFGSGKQAIWGGVGVLAKGAVAAADIAYEKAAPRVLPSEKREALEARVQFFARRYVLRGPHPQMGQSPAAPDLRRL